jgi:predicted amidohydrolase
VRIAVVQLNSQDDVEQNLRPIAGFAERAKADRADAMFLPENCVFMGDPAKRIALSEPLPDLDCVPTSPALARLSELARHHEMHIFAGSLPLYGVERDRPFNAQIVFAPDGKVLARYRKLHLYDVDLADGTHLRESDATSPGDLKTDLVTAKVGAFTFGLSICYDVRFPEIYRALVDRGADAMAVPAAFTVMTGKDHWHVLLRARAIESQSYVIAAAQWGQHPRGRSTYGKSLVIDPWGDVVAQAPDGVSMCVVDLDPGRVVAVRNELPSLRHRRLRA